MLIQLGINDSIAKCHSLARRIPGGVVAWNGNSYEELVLINKSKYQTKLFWAAFMASGGLLCGLNAARAWKSGDLAMSVLSGLFAFASAAYAPTSLSFRANASDCAAFLNGLLSVANEWRHDPEFQAIARPIKLYKLLTTTLIASQMVYPWLFSIVALAWPCSPLNMLSPVILGWCSRSEGTSTAASWAADRVVTGVGAALLQFVLWKALASEGILYIMHMFVGPLCQKTLLQLLSARLLRSGGFSSHWKLYRSCQMLNSCFGNYCSSVVMAVLAIWIVAEISSTYLVCRILAGSSNHLPLLIKMMVAAICATSYLVHVVAVGEAGKLNTISKSVLVKITQQSNSSNGRRQSSSSCKLTRRQIRSAWPLKIRFGGSNFVEAATTLVILDFTFRRLVDLLLIEG